MLKIPQVEESLSGDFFKILLIIRTPPIRRLRCQSADGATVD